MEFEMKPGWDKELQRQLRPAMQRFADDHQRQMDAISEQYAGQPVERIQPVVERELAIWGGNITDDAELMRIATAIHEGQRVVLGAG